MLQAPIHAARPQHPYVYLRTRRLGGTRAVQTLAQCVNSTRRSPGRPAYVAGRSFARKSSSTRRTLGSCLSPAPHARGERARRAAVGRLLGPVERGAADSTPAHGVDAAPS